MVLYVRTYVHRQYVIICLHIIWVEYFNVCFHNVQENRNGVQVEMSIVSQYSQVSDVSFPHCNTSTFRYIRIGYTIYNLHNSFVCHSV